MADIEKVKTGLFEMLQRDTWKDIDNERHRFQPVLNDALAMLKEQQARVLTYKEAKELKTGTDIWMEHKRDRIVLPFTFKSFTQGYVYKWFHFYGIETQSIKAMLYGSSVRFWTAKPSDEQRKAVPWETH